MRDQIANICWIIEKARLPKNKKKSTSALLTTPKPVTVWIATNCGKFFKRWEYQTCLLRNLYAGQKQQLEVDMEQQTGSNWEKSTSRLYIITLLI